MARCHVLAASTLFNTFPFDNPSQRIWELYQSTAIVFNDTPTRVSTYASSLYVRLQSTLLKRRAPLMTKITHLFFGSTAISSTRPSLSPATRDCCHVAPLS